MPGLGVGVHHAAGAQVLLRRAALDEVGRQGEGRTGEADDGHVAELARDDADRLGDGAGCGDDLGGVDRRDAVDVGGRADGVGEDGAAAGLDLDVDAGQQQRHDDVAEEHRGIHPVPAHRLQRDLGGERRVEARVEHAGAHAKVAVFGKGAPGLSHEPDGETLRTVALEGAQKRGRWPLLHPPTRRSRDSQPRARYPSRVLLCVTASHKTAPFELLERLSVHTDRVAATIAGHDECVQGAVVVATCNRFEAYVEMDEPVTAAGAVGVEAALLAIESATGVTPHRTRGVLRGRGRR